MRYSLVPVISLGVTLAALQAGPSSAIVLLDNTNNLSTSNLQLSNGPAFGGNTSPYTRLNGYTFTTGSDGYILDTISIPMQWGLVGTITADIRVSLYENATTAQSTPTAGATPLYSQDFGGNVFTTTPQFFSFSPSSAWLLKPSTGYSIVIGTDRTISPTSFFWSNNSNNVLPTSTIGYTAKTLIYSTDAGASFVTSSTQPPIQLSGTLAVAPPASADVPGPLPIMGAAAAFSMGRRLRKRIHHPGC
jgi:hypothetical protein